MCKAVFSIIDCELILSKQYSFSYKKKVELINILKPELNNISLWALKEKLNPSDITMTGDEVKSLYSNVVKLFYQSMFKGISKYYNKEIKSTKNYIFYFNFSKKHLFVLLKGLIRKKTYSNFIKFYKINFAQSYIIEYYLNKNESNNYMLSYVHSQLKFYSNLELIDNYEWNEYRVALSKFIDRYR